MIRFAEFGLTGIVLEKIFGYQRDEEGNAVSVYSEHGGPIDLAGDDARQFMVFARDRAEGAGAPEAPALVAAPTPAIRPTPQARKSAP